MLWYFIQFLLLFMCVSFFFFVLPFLYYQIGYTIRIVRLEANSLFQFSVIFFFFHSIFHPILMEYEKKNGIQHKRGWWLCVTSYHIGIDDCDAVWVIGWPQCTWWWHHHCQKQCQKHHNGQDIWTLNTPPNGMATQAIFDM